MEQSPSLATLKKMRAVVALEAAEGYLSQEALAAEPLRQDIGQSVSQPHGR